jgi:hypothetical protein
LLPALQNNDRLYGGLGNDLLDGGDGIDILQGDVGDDMLMGGDKDTLYGGEGNDLLSGATGLNIAYGGDGDDLYLIPNYTTGIPARSIVHAGEGTDVVYAGYLDDQLFGNGGQDYIAGYHGNDLIDGGSGNDRVDGQDGDDTVRGGAGDDLIEGGNGLDLLYGNSGQDQFLYFFRGGTISQPTQSNDIVMDFDISDDLLSLSAWLRFIVIPPTSERHDVTFAELDSSKNGILDDPDRWVRVENVAVEGITKLSTVIEIQSGMFGSWAGFVEPGTVTLFGATGLSEANIVKDVVS